MSKQSKVKGKLPLKGDGKGQKHRNKWESDIYWSIERAAAKRQIEKELKDS